MNSTENPNSISYRRILVPIDFSEHSGAACRHALGLAGGDASKLYLLHIVEPFHPSWKTESADLQREYRAEARTHLDEFTRKEFATGNRPHVDLAQGHPVEEILQRVEVLQPDLMVLGTHGRRGFKRMMIGSVAERLVRYCSCPVLVVR